MQGSSLCMDMATKKLGNFVHENIHMLNVCVNKFSWVPL